MHTNTPALGELLLQYNILSEEELTTAREKAESRGMSLEEILREENVLTNTLLDGVMRAYADAFIAEIDTPEDVPTTPRAKRRTARKLLLAARREENHHIQKIHHEERQQRIEKEWNPLLPAKLNATLSRATKQIRQQQEKAQKQKDSRAIKAKKLKEERAIQHEKIAAEKAAKLEKIRKEKEARKKEIAEKNAEEKKKREAEIAKRKAIKEEAKRKKEEERKAQRAKIAAEKAAKLEKIRKEKEARKTAKVKVVSPPSSVQEIPQIQKQEVEMPLTQIYEKAEEIVKEKEKQWEEEKKSLLAKIEKASLQKEIPEERKPELKKEVALIDTAQMEILSAQKEQAEKRLQEERALWEEEKKHIREQASAEALEKVMNVQEGSTSTEVDKKLAAEIAEWKAKSAQLEQERLALEQARKLEEEKQNLKEEERRVEQERLQLARERLEKEKEAVENDAAYTEAIHDEKAELAEERKKLEEEKRRKEQERIQKIKEQESTAKEQRKKSKVEKKKQGKKGKKVTEKREAPKLDIGQILFELNYIDAAELERAQSESQRRHITIETMLREEGLITKELIQNAIAEYYKMPFADLGSDMPEASIIERIPEEVALSFRVAPVEFHDDGSMIAATCMPERAEEIREKLIETLDGVTKVELVYTSRDAIETMLALYQKPLNTRFRKIIEARRKIAPEIIEEIFRDAIQLRASDIHFEPQESIVIVRFRVDGVMHEAGRIPKQFYEGIVNRIKIASNMRIDEHYAAQDGAIRWKHDDKTMDVRVSIVPIVDGEKIVMRLLSEYVRTLTLRDLGFTPKQLDVLVKAAHKPFGMILTTGPTGSGKSTTLYGLMKIRNSPDVNISTIEDPVEYKIPGINHIQVNVKANLTFERGLRALVRQDPDVILVGEIRDDITAQISVNAALTGHLLFSTLHANDASTAVPRLLEMGIEPYLLASTLEVIIAQRLMRRVCPNCRFSYRIPASEARQLFNHADVYFNTKDEITLFKGKGCMACGDTGFKGRVGVYEILRVSPEIEELITARSTSGDIDTKAREQGMLTLFEDGLQKVLSGLSTTEELLRIAAPPDPLPGTSPELSYETPKEQSTG